MDSDVMLIELIKDDEYPSGDDLNKDDDVGEEEFEGNHFDKFPTCSELADEKSNDDRINLPDGTQKEVTMVGNVKLTKSLTLFNVFYVPDFKFNLLSVGRMGHTSLSKMTNINDCKSLDTSDFFCDTCLIAKNHRLLFNRSTTSSSVPFELLHVDLWGLYKTLDLNGAQ
ncbi:hypothetical protein Tco_1006145 [Tanacetum coccineum]|uniref:Retrovirus-related Pol polyprotein from transposon TNT 1-94-like beta-barrel domain-containing protein n=1 Tax=Tanacetum coccineum TaxID=301880 RepID=A0ABQ5FH55_9ASTR